MALAYRATYVATSLAIIMALMASLLHNVGRRSGRRRALATPAIPASDGADWMWELNESGNLVGLAGNAPDHLLPPSGRSLSEAAGPIGSTDMRWDRLNAAICGKHAFEGLLVPFQLPGREGLLTIFELSGQPVLASGGFWGTASLMSEEEYRQVRSGACGAAATFGRLTVAFLSVVPRLEPPLLGLHVGGRPLLVASICAIHDACGI